ncbi:hypothetical protein [Xanthomonas sp. MUS 060]|uniref:hypothetical protein n=1 Tax=Xanthomonas sp. MUS 060 TaxID=1588031 RepID=UPI0005F291D7|nr:hypothetical protein [Xanthomonas sp. MUS 060]
MNLSWSDFIGALGKDESGVEFIKFISNFDETPVTSNTPEEYNDPEGRTRFYKFLNSGVELGIRSEKLNHIHFFIQSHEGFLPYSGQVFDINVKGCNYQGILKEFGRPKDFGGGRQDPLIGYVNKWISYDFDQFGMHMEFSLDDKLWKVTLLGNI